MGEAKQGKQPIQIEWLVRDPQGKKLGTVSQKNEIPEGSLDGEWGKTADAGRGRRRAGHRQAAAAAQGHQLVSKLAPVPPRPSTGRRRAASFADGTRRAQPVYKARGRLLEGPQM